MSVHRVRLHELCIHSWILLAEWVSPFGHCGINACCQLPHTFRRLPRPSSPLTAKASTVCAYSLDHITPSRLGVNVVANKIGRAHVELQSLMRISYAVFCLTT